LGRDCELARFFVSSRRRHTRSKRDWSSDVCSSDLGGCSPAGPDYPLSRAVVHTLSTDLSTRLSPAVDKLPACNSATNGQRGRVEDRKSVVEGKSVERGGSRRSDDKGTARTVDRGR